MPKVTVMTPVYNGEKYLRKMMDSILAQTFTDFEFIIINDGSTDSTETIIKSYNDSRIRYFKNDRNRGIPYTYNRAIDLSQGEFLAVAEADDISHPRRLEIQTKYMQANATVGLVCSKQKIFNKTPPQFTKPNSTTAITKSANESKHGVLFYSPSLVHASTMYRKTILTEHKLDYDCTYKISGDYDLFLRMSRVTDMVQLSCVLLGYRVHANNTSKDMPTANAETNIAYKKFFRNEFGFDLHGKMILESETITQAEFAEYIETIHYVLSYVKKHSEYNESLLMLAAAVLCHKFLKAAMKGGINNKEAFHLYRNTPLLHHIDNAKKTRLWVKYVAYQLGLKRK